MPLTGSSILGAEIVTPGIGPATEGLSGVELFDASHALNATTTAATPAAVRRFRLMDLTLVLLVLSTLTHPRRARLCTTLRIGSNEAKL
jgi:hypothetical protein